MILGKNTGSHEDALISEQDRREHMHVIGSTGTGKSKFLEGMIRQDILENNGLCLIDPTGALYNNLVRWMETFRLCKNRKIILLDPTEKGWSFGFNPLISDFETAYLVDNMVNAVSKVWGGEDQDRTPRLKKCLRLIFYVLAKHRLSLLEAQRLINPHDPTLRHYLTRGISDSFMQEEWNVVNKMTTNQFVEDFASTRNRLMEFISAPAIRNIIGQTGTVINFKQAMEEGHIVLVNLQPKGISFDNIRLLGTLIVNDLFLNAMTREEGAKSFYLYIDECSLFLNEDIGLILDLCRKFGLPLILSHQHLGHLKDAGEKIYRSVMNDAKTKAVFGGLEYEEAEIMVKNVFTSDVELQEWKTDLTRPTVVDYNRVWFENYGKSRGHTFVTSDTEVSGGGAVSTHGTGTAIATHPGMPDLEYMKTVTDHIGSASSDLRSTGRGKADGKTDIESEGGSEGLEPIFRDLPIESYTLEEQIWRRVALMREQSTRYAIIKMPNQKSQFVKTPLIEEGFANDVRVRRFKEDRYLAADCVKPFGVAAGEIAQREQAMLEEARLALLPSRGGPKGVKPQAKAGEIQPPDFGDDEPPPDVKEAIARKISPARKTKK